MIKDQFFKLNAKYQVAEGSSVDELMDDACCLAAIVSDSLSALAMNIDTGGNNGNVSDHRGFCQILYGLSYLSEMSHRAACTAHGMLDADGDKKVQS